MIGVAVRVTGGGRRMGVGGIMASKRTGRGAVLYIYGAC